MKQVVISLLEKPGKNPIKLANWRPISLVNCDAKIYSKILANRIEGVIKELIHEDQTGFIKGRSIHENITDLLSIIDYVNRNDLPIL